MHNFTYMIYVFLFDRPHCELLHVCRTDCPCYCGGAGILPTRSSGEAGGPLYMNNQVYRTPFSDIERKKEVAKSKERIKEIHKFINY